MPALSAPQTSQQRWSNTHSAQLGALTAGADTLPRSCSDLTGDTATLGLLALSSGWMATTLRKLMQLHFGPTLGWYAAVPESIPPRIQPEGLVDAAPVRLIAHSNRGCSPSRRECCGSVCVYVCGVCGVFLLLFSRHRGCSPLWRVFCVCAGVCVCVCVFVCVVVWCVVCGRVWLVV
jgi:hypothetical protein